MLILLAGLCTKSARAVRGVADAGQDVGERGEGLGIPGGPVGTEGTHPVQAMPLQNKPAEQAEQDRGGAGHYRPHHGKLGLGPACMANVSPADGRSRVGTLILTLVCRISPRAGSLSVTTTTRPALLLIAWQAKGSQAPSWLEPVLTALKHHRTRRVPWGRTLVCAILTKFPLYPWWFRDWTLATECLNPAFERHLSEGWAAGWRECTRGRWRPRRV